MRMEPVIRNRVAATLFVVVTFLVGGCTGVISGDLDAGSNANGSDGAVGPDGTSDWDGGPDPCQGVDCGPHGWCVDTSGQPSCECENGYHAEGLTCVEDLPPDPCDGVTCGTNAHCTNGNCVCDTGYQGDPYTLCDPIPTTEELVRQELVDIAMAELGMCEGVDNRPYMLSQPGYWCYDFVAWVYQQSTLANLPSPNSLPREYVGSMTPGFRPEKGDLIKFTIQHYGMVADVSPDGLTITTIEGNFNSCVASRNITDSSVEYYGTLEGSI